MPRTDSIGGTMTADAYAALAGQHRPSDPDDLQREIQRLHTDMHLAPRDIATALGLPLDEVINVLTVY